MSRRRKPDRFAHLYESKAYRVFCSIDTKDEIDKFFTINKKYKRDVTPLVIRGARYFSIYRYYSEFKYTYMIVITKMGARLLEQLCGECEDHETVADTIYRYAYKYITNNDILPIFKLMLPIVVKDYIENKFTLGSPYLPEKLDGRYVCIFYPIFEEEIKGLRLVLNKIHLTVDKEMTKCQLQS